MVGAVVGVGDTVGEVDVRLAVVGTVTGEDVVGRLLAGVWVGTDSGTNRVGDGVLPWKFGAVLLLVVELVLLLTP